MSRQQEETTMRKIIIAMMLGGLLGFLITPLSLPNFIGVLIVVMALMLNEAL